MTARRGGESFALLFGGLSNALLVGGPPALLLGLERTLHDPRAWLFLPAISAVAIAEGAAVRSASGVEPLSLRALTGRLDAAAAMALLATFWLALATASAGRAPAELAGGILMLALGAGLRVLAILTLGRHFLSGPDLVAGEAPARPAAFVTSGIYARLRHPSETGQLLLAMGAAVLLGSLAAGMWVVAVVLPMTLVRLRHEEARLCARNPDYRDYCCRTPALLPLKLRITVTN
jgi:protein-S-isoprenylcysteine O-methyltransferase Ste14